ncbi:pentatricopeptide repeat-containing protein At4g02750-like [Selaginella moellendorffii]|uniref:pentatricopeptide repeat-containing protein At4g02750-like n=1 Tax=Selaginella moellendorffii TaxID=88036 RepID=UPI000D1C9EAD|nr:pentatricopeptide repeat-containing protein At4g02750-like [Selaginella moellendorffii]|eukprot:XP_024532518.1 pentatricopeptide repeat-containing protein At4g02750-like [Selaginella moellendorffii]
MPEHDLFSVNAVLFAFAENGHLDSAKVVFSKMPARNLVSWTTMLGALSQFADVESTFEEMPEHDVVSCTCAIAAFSRHGHLESSLELFHAMRVRNFSTCTAILSGYVHCGLLKESERFFHDQMPQHDLVSVTTLLVAYTQSQRLEEASCLFDSLPYVDAVCWNAIATGLSQCGLLDETTKILDKMPLSLARKVFQTMPLRSVESFSVMLTAYAQASSPSDVFDSFEEMKIVEMPDDSCFTLVLMASSQVGEPNVGGSYFNSMRLDYGVAARKQHYCCIVDMLGRAGYLHAAEELVQTMPFLPNSWDWTSMLSSSRGDRIWKNGARVTKRALLSGPSDGAALVLLARSS